MTTPIPSIDAHAYQALFNCLKNHSFQRGQFTLASGKQSTFYLDCRKTTLSAEGSLLAGRLLYNAIAPLHVDAVGGMTLGADPIVTAITYTSALQGNPIHGFLVRKEAKGHGTTQQVEGHLQPWMRVAIVEDVVTTGGSALKTIDIIQAQYPSIQIMGVFALVNRLEGGKEAFTQRGIPFQALYTIDAFLQE